MCPLTLLNRLSSWEENRIGLYHLLKSKKMQVPVYSYFWMTHAKPWLISMLCFCLCSLQQFILSPCVFPVLRMAYVIPPSAPSPAVTMRVFLSLPVVSPAFTLWGNNITLQSDLTNATELCLVKNFHWINQVTATLLSILPFELQVLSDFYFFLTCQLSSMLWQMRQLFIEKFLMHAGTTYICPWSHFYLSM